MGDTWKNEYKDMKFVSKEFDSAIAKTRESFDSALTDAGMQAGMASGQSGMNVSRVTADTYMRGMSSRDSTVAGIQTQKAQAESQFEKEKASMVAQAEMAHQAETPGFMDWVSGVIGVASGVATMNPWGIFGGAQKLVGTALGGKTASKPNIRPQTEGKYLSIPTVEQAADTIKNFSPKTIDPTNGTEFMIKPRKKSKDQSFWDGGFNSGWNA